MYRLLAMHCWPRTHAGRWVITIYDFYYQPNTYIIYQPMIYFFLITPTKIFWHHRNVHSTTIDTDLITCIALSAVSGLLPLVRKWSITEIIESSSTSSRPQRQRQTSCRWDAHDQFCYFDSSILTLHDYIVFAVVVLAVYAPMKSLLSVLTHWSSLFLAYRSTVDIDNRTKYLLRKDVKEKVDQEVNIYNMSLCLLYQYTNIWKSSHSCESRWKLTTHILALIKIYT